MRSSSMLARIPRALYLLSAIALLLLLLTIAPANTAATYDPAAMPLRAQPEDDSVKVIAPPGVLNTDTEGVTLWHDYGSFALYRVSEDALNQLSPAAREQVVVAEQMDRLLFDRNTIDTQAPQAAAALAEEAPEAEAALHLIQFVGPVKDEWLGLVQDTGAVPIQYIASNGYLLWADADSRVDLDRLTEVGDIVQFSAPLPPSLKFGPSLSDRLSASPDMDEVVTVVIQIVDHDGMKDSQATIENLAATRPARQHSEWTRVLNYENAVFSLRLSDIETVSRLPDVYWIEERLERELLDEVQGQILAGNFDPSQSGPSGPGYLPWLDGHGFSTNPADYPVVDITDDGIGNGTVNSGDYTLHQFGDTANPTRLEYVANCTTAPDGSGPDGHGHINVSIAGGYDTTSGFPFRDPLGFQRGLGISPYGRFAGTRVFGPGFNLSNCGGTDAGLIQSIYDNGAQISSNSWGCRLCAGTYDDSSQAFDAGTRDADPTQPGNQEMIFVFAAGNAGPSAGTVGTPGNGKNMITVGASENDRASDEDGSWTDGCNIGPTGADNAMDVISFSSRGPSPGNRVKPEVIAPGTHIQGTASTSPDYNGSSVCDQFRPSGQTTFAASSGTSHSTPAVAGVTSLAYHWMENALGVSAPSAAVMKAYLIAHPTYLTGVSANDTLPSNNQGYGMPNMSDMFDDTTKYLLDQSVTFDETGETWTWEGAVADPSKPVRIVLAYTDAPGAVGTSPQVNDLNLTASIDGTAYLGNVFSGQWSTTGGSADPFNNYEAIFLPPGTDGALDITVTGFNIAGDGVPNSGDGTDQDFALVCYNCAQTPTYSLNVTPATLDICAPDNAVYDVAVGSILGFSDPVTLSASGNPAGTTANFSTNPVTPPGSSELTVGNTGAAAAGSYVIDVSGSSTTGSRSSSVNLNLFTAIPEGPDLVAPADGADNVAFRPEFGWTAVSQASSYHLEVATDPGFTNVVYQATETGNSHVTEVPLNALTTYYWRVTVQNVCGSSVSATFSFTTQAATMVCNSSLVDFESGIPDDWQVVDNTDGTGLVWVTTADPACEIENRTNGSGEAACADSDATGIPAVPFDTELVSNPFDLSPYAVAELNVKAYYRDLNTGSNDRFEVDVWDGTSWTTELSWDEDHEPEDFSLNLSDYVGLPTVQVRFHYFGNGFDWFAQVDDVGLTCLEPGPPVVDVAPDSLSASQGPGVVSTQPMTVTNQGASPLNWNIVETESDCASPADVPWLSVSPDAGTTSPLESDVVDVSLDSAGLTPGDYTANLCVNSDDPATPLVPVPVTLTVEEPEVIACNAGPIDFEDGLPNTWTVVDNTGGTGLVWVTTADPACEISNRTNGSGEAACADSDATGSPAVPYDTELWTNSLDLSSYGAVVLDVKAYYRDITTNGNDRFEVDVWDGATWNTELSWDEDHEPEDFSLNLSGYAGLPETRVRFRYFGNGFDWYAQVDDVTLTCAEPGPPSIAVDPASLVAEQGPGVIRSQELTIDNNGGSDLNWSINEAPGDCSSHDDVPWLSVSPDNGTIIPLDSDIVDVSFDSSGLDPDDYTANLCISSDDPETPVLQVPVTLTVLPPFVLSCNGPVADFNNGIPSGWPVLDNIGNGIVWTTMDASGEGENYTGGDGDAATASSDRAGALAFDTELRTYPFELSRWLPNDTVTLNYLVNYQNFAFRDFLDLDISSDGGATWTTLLSWNEDHGSFRNPPGESVDIDLAAYAGVSDLQLRWRYYDPLDRRDWYAQVDDASLACTLDFSGFFGTISNPPEVNEVRTPAIVPVIFSLNGDRGLDIFAEGYPATQEIDCTTLEPSGPITPTETPGNSGLAYDPELDRYTYPWQTQPNWANSCRQLMVQLYDGVTHVAYFRFVR